MASNQEGERFDPAYIAGLLDVTSRVRFEINKQPEETFTVRPTLRIKPHGTEMREAVIGEFLDFRDYQYSFIEGNTGDDFFRLNHRSDLNDLGNYLTNQSAHLVRELEFVDGEFADKYDHDILDPEDAYQFLLTRDELRHGWRPRGRYHTAPKDLVNEFEIDGNEIGPSALPTGNLRSDYTVEWIAGIFDGLCRYRPSISQSSEHEIGYAMYPIARLHRAGVHRSLIGHFQRFCEDYDLKYGDLSDENVFGIVFTGPSFIRRILDILFPRLIVLAQHSAAMTEDILPRFDNEEHHTKQGFYDLLQDFDPMARASGGPFRQREYHPAYFEKIWNGNINTSAYDSELEQNNNNTHERIKKLEKFTITPKEYKNELNRYQTIVDRRHRSREKVVAIKSLYNDRCQLCGNRLAKGDGTGYSEVHHLRPLGRPHDGPDSLNNMIVLCPNHHSDFDNGVVIVDDNMKINHPYDDGVDGKRIRVEMEHSLATKSIRYHNEVISRLGDAEKEGYE